MTQLMPPDVTDAPIQVVESQVVQPKFVPLRQSVREHLRQYFMEPERLLTNLYDVVLTEVELPMLEIILSHCGQNQSRASRALNISRGTLRKKMKRYGLLPGRSNRIK